MLYSQIISLRYTLKTVIVDVQIYFYIKKIHSIKLTKMLLDARPSVPQTAVPALIPPGYAIELQPLGASWEAIVFLADYQNGQSEERQAQLQVVITGPVEGDSALCLKIGDSTKKGM